MSRIQAVTQSTAGTIPDAIWSAKTLTIKKIDISSLGDNTIISATAGKKHYIIKLVFVAGDAVSVTLKDGTTAISGAMEFAANQGFAYDGDLAPIILSTNSAFVINLSAAVNLRGFVIYFTE